MASRDAETGDISHTSDDNGDHEKHAVPEEEKTTNGKVAYDETTGSTSFAEVSELRQGLHQRHIQMIALAGTIGTGLFLGSGIAIVRGGPVGALISYTVIGLAAACVCLATGEMGALVPLSGGINRYAETFVDPALAFAEGCNSIYGVLVGTPAEMVAAAVLVDYWSHISNAVWITIFSLAVLITTLLFVRVYGELEFGFSMLKILLIVIVNITALVVTCGGGPDHKAIGFKYWVHPGPFAPEYLGFTGSKGAFLGFWTTLSNAVYAYSAIQNFTMAAAETKSPRRNIPIAAKRIFIRIALFYVITIFMVTLVVPSNDPHLLKSTGTASQSPFVISAVRAGIKTLPSFINAILLTSAWSAGNSFILSGSRTLYGLANRGLMPKVFLRLNRFSVPWVAISFIGLFMALGYMTLDHTAATVFTWLQSLVAVSTLVDWIIILSTYLRLYYGCRAQGIDRRELPWAAPLQPYISWAALCLFSILLFFGGYTTFIHGDWDTETFISSYLNIPLIIAVFVGYKLIKKPKHLRLNEIPIRPFIEIAKANPEPAPTPKKGWRKLNILWS